MIAEVSGELVRLDVLLTLRNQAADRQVLYKQKL